MKIKSKEFNTFQSIFRITKIPKQEGETQPGLIK